MIDWVSTAHAFASSRTTYRQRFGYAATSNFQGKRAYFTMFLSYFGPVFRHSIQTMCTVCFREDFLRFLEGVNRIFNKKTFPEPLCSHDGRVICAAQHCNMLHEQDLAVHNPFSGLWNFLRGTKYFLRETMNSLRGTNIVFRDTNVNCLWATKYFLRETMNSLRGTNISCGSTRPFAHGKMGLYPWGVCVLCVTSIPTVKLSMGNHYGYIKKNKRITHDISRTKS